MIIAVIDNVKSHIFRYKSFNPITKENDKENCITTKFAAENHDDFINFYNNELSSIKPLKYHLKNIQLKYENFTMEECLRRLLSAESFKEFPKGFEVIGSIAHLNLREEFLPLKHLVGALIIDVSLTINKN